MPTLQEVEHLAINRAAQAVRGLSAQGAFERPRLGLAATLPGARAVVDIDPETGFPAEGEVAGLFIPGSVPGSSDVLS